MNMRCTVAVPFERRVYVYREYPRWKYGAKGAAVVVNNAKEEEALGPGWYNSPADVPNEPIPIASDNATLHISPTEESVHSSGTRHHSIVERSSECERSHLATGLCEGCGSEFVPKRPWQRGCGRPSCRAAASRRRWAAELRAELERIAKALDSEDVQGARARLADLVSRLCPRQSR